MKPVLRSSAPALVELWRELLAARPPRAASLVVSVFGDAVVPHGGVVWLGTLIRWLAPLGINERAVRTAVHRLAADGWFEARSAGRRADYTLTEVSRMRFADAERRIYAAAAPPWDGGWTIVVLGATSVDVASREAARRELRWHGFGELAPSVLVHPSADRDELGRALGDLGLDGKALVLRAEGETRLESHAAPLRELVTTAWDLRDLEESYAEYVRRFSPLGRRLRTATADPELAFQIRIFAIHEYRRILLHDPELPAELLPERWIGDDARQLCAAIYAAVAEPAARFIVDTGETATGRLPSPRSFHYRRFGGTVSFQRRTSPRTKQVE